MVKHVNIILTGRVQGVFYRTAVRDKAKELGINGIVRNEPDGSVCIEAEGTPSALGKLTAWCAEGPRLAQVLDIKMSAGKMKGFQDFIIDS